MNIPDEFKIKDDYATGDVLKADNYFTIKWSDNVRVIYYTKEDIEKNIALGRWKIVEQEPELKYPFIVQYSGKSQYVVNQDYESNCVDMISLDGLQKYSNYMTEEAMKNLIEKGLVTVVAAPVSAKALEQAQKLSNDPLKVEVAVEAKEAHKAIKELTEDTAKLIEQIEKLKKLIN